MILGMTTSTFTLLHVLISLVGIVAGLVVMYGFITARRLDRWNMLFLATTALTSLTGFAFPNKHVTPGIVIGVLSMVVLAIAVLARYALRMSGPWRSIYVISSAIALYFNVFVFVVQSFEKIPAIRALAPTQKEPPFAISQLVVLVLFVVATVASLRRFHSAATGTSITAAKPQKRAA